MRSSNSTSSRTPATDFVQDYAAKRQAQMDRARQLREDRLQHQSQSSQPGSPSNLSGDGGGSGVSSPGMGMGSGASPTGLVARPPPHVPRSRYQGPASHQQQHGGPLAGADSGTSGSEASILYVRETDFKQATQAGILTPDQARQLWAMLSNQIIRVRSPSAANAVSVSSLMALSNNSSASSSAAPGRAGSPNGGNASRSTGGDGDFGASISLKSLRTSIAFFKREQQRLQQQSAAVGGGGDGVRPSSSSPHLGGSVGARAAHHPPQQPAHRGYGHAKDNEEEPEDEEEETDFNAEEEEEQQQHVIPPLRGGSPKTDGRPAWNADVDINYGGADPNNKNANARKKPRTSNASGTASKSPPSAARLGGAGVRGTGSISSTSARSAQHGGRGGRTVSSRGMREEDTEEEERSTYAPPPAASAGGANTRRGPPSSTRGTAVPPPRGGAIVNVDDMPVGGGSSGMSDWANAYPPGMEPPSAPSSVGPRANRGGMGFVSVPENEEIAAEAEAVAHEAMHECPTCGRTFRESVVARHAALCRKHANKPRKVFNMRDQRLEGVEGIEAVQRAAARSTGGGGPRGGGGGRAATNNADAAKGKLPKWKMQHEQFQAAMRAVRQPNEGGAGGFGSGGALAPPPPPVPDEYDDRVPCPHCGRKFAEDVAARHIPKCATTVAKPKGIRPIRR